MFRLAAVVCAGVAVSGCSFVSDRFPTRGHDTSAKHAHAAPAAYRSPMLRRDRGYAIELEIGHEAKSSSEFHGGQNIPGALTVEARDFGDTHESGLRVALRGSKRLNPRTEVSAAVSYTQLDSAGVITVGAVGVDPITAEFDDYTKTAIEVGVRRYVGDTGQPLQSRALRPFVGATVGLAQIDAMSATFESAGFPGLGLSLPTTIQSDFYDDSIVPTVGVQAGLDWQVTPNAAIEVETGLRWDAAPDDDDATLSTLGLDGINDTAGRVVIPVAIRGRLTF